MISVYQPCNSENKEGSVKQQHVRCFRNEGRNRDPRKALCEDLFEECDKWKKQGENLIIAIDANEDIRKGDTYRFFEALGMRELILEKHARNGSPPATHASSYARREPIDGIFATAGMRFEQDTTLFKKDAHQTIDCCGLIFHMKTLLVRKQAF